MQKIKTSILLNFKATDRAGNNSNESIVRMNVKRLLASIHDTSKYLSNSNGTLQIERN